MSGQKGLRAVVYTRVSNDDQNVMSHEDQARACEDRAAREGWRVLRQYTDHGISGTTSRRPEYQAMLAAAEARQFDVLLLWELLRLSRDVIESERAARVLEFIGVRIVTIRDGYDSTLPSKGLYRAIHAAMGAEFIVAVSRATHRGLVGAALRKQSVGGRAYGYRSEPLVGPDGRPAGARPVIDEEQARWVRWIFERYAAGWSPRKIARELNARGVPSPGATWRRVADGKRRDGKWLTSTLYGDPERRTGMLHNELYRGVRVWNRTRRDDDPKTNRKVFLPRPEAEWLRVEVPELRIVPDALWARVRAREAEVRARYGARVKAALAAGRDRPGAHRFARRGIREPKYVLSGLVKCAACGASYVISGPNQAYTCASHTNGGEHACANRRRIPRVKLEERLFTGIAAELTRPEWRARFEAEARAILAARSGEANADRDRRAARLATVATEKRNVMTAIKAGIITATTKAELEALEAEEAALAATPVPAEVIRVLPRALERYEALVAALPATLARDPARARAELRLIAGGNITLRPDGDGLYADVPLAGLANLLNANRNMSIGSGGTLQT